MQNTKYALSVETRARFDFHEPPIDIGIELERDQFDVWIAEDLAAIEDTLNRLLSDCSVSPDGVDAVFLTGGSSLVPAVRAIFERSFGARRLRSGEELTTVAKGLALCAADAWSA